MAVLSPPFQEKPRQIIRKFEQGKSPAFHGLSRRHGVRPGPSRRPARRSPPGPSARLPARRRNRPAPGASAQPAGSRAFDACECWRARGILTRATARRRSPRNRPTPPDGGGGMLECRGSEARSLALAHSFDLRSPPGPRRGARAFDATGRLPELRRLRALASSHRWRTTGLRGDHSGDLPPGYGEAPGSSTQPARRSRSYRLRPGPSR